MELEARLTKLQRYSQATSFSTISCSLRILRTKKIKFFIVTAVREIYPSIVAFPAGILAILLCETLTCLFYRGGL
jgi:hypothetical protein